MRGSRSGRHLAGRHPGWRLFPAILLAVAPTVPTAAADDRWQEGVGGAVAILPVPTAAEGIVGGSLSCAEQRWTLILRPEAGAVPAGTEARARLVIGDAAFETPAREAAGTLQLGIDKLMLEPLRTGARLGVSLGEKGGMARAIFPLAGSRTVIDAIRPRCSPVDMGGYRPVPLSEVDPAVATAAELMKDEAGLFQAATGKTAAVAAATLDPADGNHLLFASLCGPGAYYGPSGCTLSGFAREGDAGEWREVYNTDGVVLYVDPAGARDGWPDLVTLPPGGDSVLRWAWDGSAYVPAGDRLAQGETGGQAGDP